MPKRYLLDGAKSIPLDVLETGLMPEFLQGAPSRTATPAAMYGTVAYLYRCVDVRANALAAVPWVLYQGEREIVTNGADVWPDALAWCANLEDLLWQTEAALCLTAAAYWHKLRNVRRGAVGLQWFDPAVTRPVWGPQGITAFERTYSGGRKESIPADDVVYVRLLGTSETEPRPAPAAAACTAAGVLYNTDEFVSAYFKRGAIKATILTVEGNPLPAERDRLRDWWRRFISGIDRAFTAEVVSAQVAPVVVGEGLSDLTNVDLTTSRREDIATALGVPHSLVMSNAANYATANADRLNFYETTILPECNLLSRQVNAQLLAPLGYRLEFRPEQMPIYQADENDRAAAFAAYVNAGIKPSIVAQMLGLHLPDGIEPEDLDPEPQPQTITVLPPQQQPAQLADSQAQTDAPAVDARQQEARKFLRWAKGKRSPDVARFASDILSDADKRALLADSDAGQDDTPPLDTPDAWAAYKAMLLAHDPGDDNTAEERALLAAEDASQREIAKALRKQFRSILPPDAENMDIVQLQNYIEQRVGNQAVRDAINAAVRRAVDVGVNIAADQLTALSVGFDYTLIHTAARDWATVQQPTHYRSRGYHAAGRAGVGSAVVHQRRAVKRTDR